MIAPGFAAGKHAGLNTTSLGEKRVSCIQSVTMTVVAVAVAVAVVIIAFGCV
jgi:hypothetical protein